MRSRSVLPFLSVLLLFPCAFPRPALAQDALTGRVVDTTGRPVPRAYVRILDPGGLEVAGAFSDTDGHFRFSACPQGCRVEASLTGFTTSVAACGSSPVGLTMGVAPVHESISVSATRSEVPVSQLGASVTVFDAADLDRRQAPAVADLLMAAPGVAIARAGGLGNVTSLFVRGGESNYNKVLLDGIPLNEPGGFFNFSNITSDNLERVEIVRGAHSALFGSDAMASVIQLVTRRARQGQRPRADASTEGGSYGTARARAGITGAHGLFDYSTSAAWQTTNNRVENNNFHNTTLSAAGGVRLGTHATLRGVARGEIGTAGTPGATAFGRADSDAFFRRHDGVGGITFEQTIGDRLRQRASYGFSATNQASTNLRMDPPYTPTFGDHVAPFEFSDFVYDSRADLRRHSATYLAEWRASSSAGEHHITTALDWDGERGTLTDALAGSATEARRDNVGWTLQHEALWPRLFVTGSVRVEHNSSFGASTVPRVSAAFVARRSNGALGETRLKASAGRGIKEPTILQSYSRSTSFLGNPDLLPERSRGVDAGIEQRLAHDRVKLDVTWFDNRFENIISTRTLSFSPFRSQYFNIGETRSRGLELAADGAPVAALRLRGGYTFMASRVTRSTSPGNAVFGEGQWLFRRPRHSGYVEAAWASGRIAVSLAGTFVGRRVDSDFSALAPAITWNDGHTTWDLRGSYKLTPRLALTMAIDNLADADYMEPLGYPALRRALRAGVRATF